MAETQPGTVADVAVMNSECILAAIMEELDLAMSRVAPCGTRNCDHCDLAMKILHPVTLVAPIMQLAPLASLASAQTFNLPIQWIPISKLLQSLPSELGKTMADPDYTCFDRLYDDALRRDSQ